MIKCSKCKVKKSKKDFCKGSGKRQKKNGLGSWCKQCRTKASIKWQQKNPRKHKASVLKWKFGLTLEQYESILRKQKGVCAICKLQNSNGRQLAVDHNHETGAIRGLLCGKCNQSLGLFQNSIDNLKVAAKYLRRNCEECHADKKI